MKKNKIKHLNKLESSLKNTHYKSSSNISSTVAKTVEVNKSIEVLEKALKERVFSDLNSNESEDK